MGFNLFTLSGTVTANVQPFVSSIATVERRLIQVSRLTDQFSRRIGRTFALATGIGAFALGIGGIAVGLKKAVLGAGSLNESITKAKYVFDSSYSSIFKNTERLVNDFGFQRQAIVDASASFGLMGRAAGYATDKAADLAVTMTNLAADASSFYDVPLPVALTKIRSGLAGMPLPLREFGVLLSASAVKNKAFALGLAKSNKELTDQVKVVARAKLIEEGLSVATGDLERTQGSFANRLRKVQGQIENTLVAIGQKILPIFANLVESTSKLLGQFDTYLAENGAYVQAWAEKIGSAISLVALVWRNFADFRALGILIVHEKLLQGFTIIARVAKVIWDNITHGAQSALTILTNVFSGLAKYLGTLFESLGKALGVALANGVTEFANSPIINALGQIPIFTAQVAALQTAAKLAQLPAPPVKGDASGLTAGAILKGVGGGPGGFGKVLKDLPNFGKEIGDLVQKLHNVNVKDFLSEALAKVGKSIGSPLSNKSAVTRLNEDNARRGLNRPPITATDKQAQKRAEETLKDRAAADAKAKGKLFGPQFNGSKLSPKVAAGDEFALAAQATVRRTRNLIATHDAEEDRALFAGLSGKSLRDAIESQRLKRAAQGGQAVNGSNGARPGARIGGPLGNIGQIGGEFAGKLVEKLTGNPKFGEIAKGVVGFAIGGAGGGLPGRRGRNGRVLGGPQALQGTQKDFKSEFIGLSDLSRKISTDALSKSTKDPQLNVLEGIQSALGGNSPSGNTVRGLLNTLVSKQGGPGFAT